MDSFRSLIGISFFRNGRPKVSFSPKSLKSGLSGSKCGGDFWPEYGAGKTCPCIFLPLVKNQ